MISCRKKTGIFIISVLLLKACSFDATIGPWKDGIIPYYLKGDFSDQDIMNIEEAMKNWENVCGVKFKKVTPSSGAYAIIRVNRQEWYSSVGENNSECRMIFGRSYSDISVIMHELGHCIGLIHEHQRPDRDLYVTINWNNMLTGKGFNFDLIDNPLYDEHVHEYDYKSIMHYETLAFSKNGSPTIVSRTSETIEPSDRITALDAAKARDIYGPPKTGTEWDEY